MTVAIVVGIPTRTCDQLLDSQVTNYKVSYALALRCVTIA